MVYMPAKCSLCGAVNTNKSSCPFNPKAKNPNPAKHNSKPAAKPNAAAAKPKPAAKTIKVTHTKSLGTTERLSARAYYDQHGPGSVGNVCDIRGNGERKCLLLRANGSPYWAKPTKTGNGQDACGDWSTNCQHHW